ncbi:hypothetical protein NAP1_14573 [Erythrobacter sp. NAP1]|uniref:hypothetical protein n=1 Tax=Erythrobacter sp. NAP1 TaxID=237727 RepID=UPI0000687955|nr:hypothetical protein [Erythrobacter sp. NAP1]EAQ28832.1 hypothetical protein NAP1_14573 [Erythrobacter sp. NAP1]
MTASTIRFAPAISLALLCACAEPEQPEAPSPQDAFFDALASHCGKAFEGRLVSEDAADEAFKDAAMVMHVSECSEDRLAVPFHVELDGEWDRSRTWLITRTGDEGAVGLRLKHDHRHADGEPDAVTMYGGDTADEGSAGSQDFPVDDESIALFEREGLGASVTNVWTVEVDPAGAEDARFAYQLERTVEGGALEPRFFRVEFDLTSEVEAPPPAWGDE